MSLFLVPSFRLFYVIVLNSDVVSFCFVSIFLFFILFISILFLSYPIEACLLSERQKGNRSNGRGDREELVGIEGRKHFN